MRDPEIHLPSAIRGHTLNIRVTGQREWAIRSWLGIQLMKLGAWVVGLEVELEWRGGTPDPAPLPALAIPPERLSTDELAKGRAAISWDDARRIAVKLEGIELDHVLAYDCGAGWVERFRTDEEGRVEVAGDKPVIDRLHGTVTAEYREAA